MKKIYLILLLVLVSFASCELGGGFLDEDPKGYLFPENFYNNEEELKMANNALYSHWVDALNRPYESMEIKYASADDILGTGNQRQCYNEIEINLENSVGIDADISKGWERCYDVINIANSIVLNHRRAEGKVTEETLNRYAAQAHFIRAYMYFWLVRFYNNIPLIETAFQPDDNKTVRCSKASEVYDLIVRDLKFAEEYLPIDWKDFDNTLRTGGAITKGAAKSTLSKVYLQMAGFPINGGNEYYALARDKAKEVIDNAGTYGYELRNHFYQVWDPYWKPYSFATDEVIIWTAQSLINDEYSVRAPNPCRPIEFGGWESMIAEKGFYERFPEGERKEYTFVTDFYKGGEHYNYMDLKCQHPAYRKMWADNLTEGWEWETRNEPNSKWRTNMEASANWYSTRSTIIMRYADILLTYAEAKARTDGPDALAYKCLNDVRNRAFEGVGAIGASLNDLSTDDFIDAVVWERAYEFAGFEHSSRWFDLQRLELVEKANTEWRNETEDKYKLVRPYSKKDYFLPIPSNELILNPGLADNNTEFN